MEEERKDDGQQLTRKIKPYKIIYPIVIGLAVVSWMLYDEFDPKAFDSITFTWNGVQDVTGYQILRGEEVIADTDDIQMKDGKYTFTLSKGEGYVADATYTLKSIAKEGMYVDPAKFDTFKATEFGWHLLTQFFNDEAKADSVSFSGADVELSYEEGSGLLVKGTGETTVRFTSHRTTQKANYLSLVLVGTGSMSVAGESVTLTQEGVLVTLSKDTFNAGFEIVFTDSFILREIQVDAIDRGKTGTWQDAEGFGQITGGETNNTYTLTEGVNAVGDPGDNHAGGLAHYIFTALAMPDSVNFTIEANIDATAAEYVAGFSVTSPANGKAMGAVMLDTRDKLLRIASWDGWTEGDTELIEEIGKANTQYTIAPGSANWVMSDEDYSAVVKDDCTMALVRSDNIFYFILDGKLLAYFDSDETPIFRGYKDEGEVTTNVSIAGEALSTGFAVMGFVGEENAQKAERGSVTFSDWTVKTSAEYAEILSSVTVKVEGTHEAEGQVAFVGESVRYDFNIAADGSAVVAVPAGSYTVYYADGANACKAENFTAEPGADEVTLTAQAAKNTMLGDSAVVNGKTLNGARGGYAIELDIADVVESALNDSFTIENDTGTAYFMPNTVTGEDYEYSVNIKNVTNMAGIFVTDGESIFGLLIDMSATKHVYIMGGAVNG